MDEIKAAAHSDTAIQTTTLLVENIHCPSCVSYAKDVLRPLPNIIKIDVSVIDHAVRVQHYPAPEFAEHIHKLLSEAAFEIQHVSTRDSKGHTQYEYELPARAARRSPWPKWLSGKSMSKVQQKHIQNCNACQSKFAYESPRATSRGPFPLVPGIIRKPDSKLLDLEKAELVSSPDQSNTPTEEESVGRSCSAKPNQQHRWTATISIEGMTCASCVGTITNLLEPKDFVDKVNINLLANSGTIQFSGPKNNVDIVIQAIEDAGYDAALVELRENKAEPNSVLTLGDQTFRLTVSIDGMTCSSCVSAITSGIEALEFVSKVNINLIQAKGIIEFSGEDNRVTILQKIDDLGYDATEIQCIRMAPEQTAREKTLDREVKIKVEGTYCPKCPQKVSSILHKTFGSALEILRLPSQSNPYLIVKYTPILPNLTIRKIITTINEADEAYLASIYHPPSDEERSSAMRRRHRNEILWRLLLALIVAIPTFVIGIVYMSLVPKSNETRLWFEQPVWTGNVTREEWALFILTTPVMFYSASQFHGGALKDIKSLWRRSSQVPILRRFYRFGSMNLLISLGTTVAYFSSLAVLIMDATSARDVSGRSSDTYFDSVTFLTLFLLIGRFLEAYAKAKTGDAVQMLANLKPSEAFLIESTDEESAAEGNENDFIRKVSTDMLEVGDIVSVPHGSSPPTDGLIDQDGAFLFNESSLTGESKPVKKSFGDQVFAGSVNVSDPVRIRVTELGGSSMLDKIVAVVREGQGKRAPIERVADVITGYFAPVVTLIAIITWIIWISLGEGGVLPKNWLDVQQGGWAFWSLEFAIAVFVVACPCGIGLAAPTALYVGGGLAAQSQILVQGGGEAFQEASNLDIIVFDKTGTLTEGKMQVTNFDMLQEFQGNESIALALGLAKMLEDSSTHPIATAISSYCESRLKELSSPFITAAEIQEVSGSGMKGTFGVKLSSNDEETTYEATLGNQRFLDSSHDINLSNLLAKHHSLGQSTAILSMRRADNKEAHPFAVFSISDPLRTTTASVLQILQTQHKLSIHMCTGDNSSTARSIAEQIGITIANVRAAALPHEKADYIKSLQEGDDGKRRIVAFVGDGSNDTPALAAADVSIALSSGSDVAITQASFILLNSDLETILRLVKLAKRVFWRVKANFVWAAIYNVCLIPVAAGIFFPIGQWRLGPVWASAAMAASSVSVVVSSLMLRLPEVEFDLGRLWRSWWKKGE